MPVTSVDTARAQLQEPVSIREIDAAASNRDLQVLQTSSPLATSTWGLLDSAFFAKRPDVELRVYGFYSGTCDLSFASRMRHVRRFAADCLQHAQGISHIAEIPELESLSLGVFDLEDFDVLNHVSPKMLRLFLGATRSKKPDLAPLARFAQLRTISLEGQQRNIEVLSHVRSLEEVTLRSISTPTLDYLSRLSRMWSLDIKLGGTRDLSAVAGMDSIKYLELWQVRGLVDIGVISTLPGLQNLFLQSLPKVHALPPLQAARSLRRVVLQNMRGLRDVTALEHAPALDEFLLVQGESCDPAVLEPVLRNPRLRRAAAYFGSERKNAAFEELLRARGIEKFEDSPFEYE